METGAVRSDDLRGQRWDLASGIFFDRVEKVMENDQKFVLIQVRKSVPRLLSAVRIFTYDFLSGSHSKGYLLEKAAICLMIAIEKEKGDSEKFAAEYQKNGPTFPYQAVLSLAETLDEGAHKYGSWNWLKGMQISSVLLNHGIHHVFRYQSGDRSEDHLGHALWGFMTSIHFYEKRADMRIELLDPDYTITPAIEEEMQKSRARRNASSGPTQHQYGDSFLHTNQATERLPIGST